MARSFSQEPRSDSHKIGETRYRMSHLPSTTTIARTLLLAGILLAVTVLAARSFFPAFAQDEVDYEENSTDTVAVYTASDPEDEDITWSLGGADSGVFSIDGGVLTFKDGPPDYEDPQDDNTDNTYNVTVLAAAGSGGTVTDSEQVVIVNVLNVEETGTIDLRTLQPKVGVAINPTLTDDDGRISADGQTRTPEDKNLAPDAEWQWATSTDPAGPWTDIDTPEAKMAAFTPRESDARMYLRVTATYKDGHGADDPFTDGVDEAIETRSAVSGSAVLVADYSNTAPIFPDQDPDTPLPQTAQEREISEDADAGDPVGAPVVASDIGADGNEETLFYELLDDDVDAGDDTVFFVIDSGSGQISVDSDANLDFDAGEEQFVVMVRATDPGNMFSEIDLIIKVTDVDEDPVIAEATADEGLTTKKIPEINSTADSPTFDRSIATYTATDQEDTSGNSLTWSLSGADSSKFELSTNTGGSVDLSLNRDVDYENTGDSGNNKDFNVRLTVTDGGNNTDTRDVTVEITNVEETGSIDILNRQPEVGTSLRSTASDPDNFVGGVTYQWATSTSAGGPWNAISGATSQNYTPRTSDASSENTVDRFFLRVTATYRDALGSEVVTIDDISEERVKPRDPDGNQSPVFTGGNPTDQVNENADQVLNADHQVGAATVEVTDDQDGTLGPDELTYTLGGTDRAFFRIQRQSNGVHIYLLADTPIDHEKKPKYTATVTATDPSNRSTTATVTVNIDDVDEAPVFSQAPDSDTNSPVTFAENSSQVVTTLKASDPEGSNIQWTVDQGSVETFSIDGGVLRFKSVPDFETTPNSYRVTVTASDGSLPRTAEFTVSVQDVEEDGEVTLSRPQPKVGVGVEATLVDPDDDAVTPTWQWATSTSATGPWYDIDATAVEDADDATYTPRESDVGYYLRATATYTDGTADPSGGTEDKASMVSDNPVIRADYMNAAPKWPVVNPDATGEEAQIAQTRKLREDAKAGDPVGDPVVASDEGADGTQETLRYSINDNNATEELFVIDSQSGQISVGGDATLNFESITTSYPVTVTATDPGSLSNEVGVTIELLNANESPEFGAENETNNVNLTSKSIMEIDATAPRYVSEYSASDHEDAANTRTDRMEWSLSGTDSSQFEFNSADDCSGTVVRKPTGLEAQLCLASQPDYESPTDANRDNVYMVTVTVTDSDGNPTSKDVTVTLTNVEEMGEVMLSARQPEVGTPITASVTDADGGVRDVEWQWSYQGGAEIESATSATYTPGTGDVGETLVAEATYRDNQAENDPFTPADESLVMAQQPSATAVIAAVANNQAPSFPDQDDDTPGDQSDRATRYVHENTKPGSEANPNDDAGQPNVEGHVGTPVAATDGDSAHTAFLDYTLSGNDASLFTIDTSGQIVVGEGTDLDFETKDTYSVTVTATDSSGASDSIIVTIKIRDVDEMPKISKRGLAVSGSRSVSYEENDTADVASYRATGSDSTGASWSLEGPDASAFAISSGILAFRSSPNYESPTDQNTDNAYEVTVKATMGSLMATRSVTVNVTNVDEPGSVSISSPNSEVKVGVELTAELDEGDEETVVGWQWASGDSVTGPWGDISGATNNTYTPVEGDVGNYLRATVTYNDPLGSGKTLSEIAGTAVEAANPAGTDGTLALSQTQPVIGNTISATLTDADNPDTTTYSWEWERSTNNSTWNPVSGATGATYTVGTADAGNYLRATLTYTDDSGAGQTATAATTRQVPVDAVYDANYDGTIDAPEVLTAVRHYFDGDITATRVLGVVQLYFAGLNQ